MRPGNAARTNTPTASSGSIFQKEPTCRVTRKPTSIKLPMFSTRVHARNSASVLRKRFISLLCSPILPLKVLHFRVETAHPWLRPYDLAVNALRTWRISFIPPDHLLRHVFENARSFGEARRRLESTP